MASVGNIWMITVAKKQSRKSPSKIWWFQCTPTSLTIQDHRIAGNDSTSIQDW
jgi:hypothetical protein